MSLEQVLEEEAAAIARRYRVDRDAALAALNNALRDRRLATAVEAEVARGKGRGSAVRRLAKEARRHVYHDLRRYTPDAAEQEHLAARLREATAAEDSAAVRVAADELLASHASTKERLPSYERFFEIVAGAVARPHAIVDLGAGLHPLAPAPVGLRAEVYVALERDERAVRILDTYAAWLRDTRLVALRADLADVDWSTVTGAAGVDSFDLAYLLKLVPVLRRQQPDALDNVRAVPAKILVVTGSREALTRRQDISRREDHVLRQFIESMSPAGVDRVETGDEIVYIVRR